ncbi:MAG: aminopeptidase P family protein [Firmicutes bacterium]|nr:aminopeptidase P family protein [Candidatus Colivicinus equi]
MNLYSKRRQNVLTRMDDNSILLLFSGKAIAKSEDECYDFDVNRNFYYLTGLEKEDMVLMLGKNNGKISESLFILPYDEYLARWVGGRMSKQEATDISDIKIVCDRDELDDTVARIIERSRGKDFKLYFDFWHYSYDQRSSEATKYAVDLKAKYPYLPMIDIFPILTSLRMVKDEYEVAYIKKAISITNLGIRKMMRNIKPELNEMVMEGVFDFVLKENLCNKNAFKTIAASGHRATILHYSTNNQVMKNGELFLCDLGATYKNYCADISRTFPVNGKFSKRQREIYEMVLHAQKIVVDHAKAGVTLRELNKMVVDYYRDELPKHGLNKGVNEYYFHSVSHHLGLDTHDVSMDEPLRPGCVITNEPGLYITDESIGIRIEDDLLIKENGCEVLSKDIIKEVDDIESFMDR